MELSRNINEFGGNLTISDNHYVLIIHGTFSSPVEGETKWYQKGEKDDENFCSRLFKLFQDTPLENSIWRGFESGEEFSWSGSNNHEDRIDAAKHLTQEINNIISKDPNARIHFIAHSHGGNVLLKMIENYHYYLQDKGMSEYRELLENNKIEWGQKDSFIANWLDNQENNRIGKIVFLGTPFLRKQWIGHQEGWKGIFESIIENLLAIPTYFIFLSLGIFVFGGFISSPFFAVGIIILSILIYFLSFPISILPGAHVVFPISEFGILNLLEFYAFGVAIFSTVFSIKMIADQLKETKKYNTNYYFDEKYNKELNVRRIPSLVMTAKYLDEALIGLASEAIVYGTLLPNLSKILEVNIGLFNTSSNIIGKKQDEFLSGCSIPLKLIFIWPFLFVIGLMLKVGVKFFTPFRDSIMKPYLTKVLFQLICSSAYGIPIAELQGARVEIKDKLQIPGVFDEQYVDITEAIFDESKLLNLALNDSKNNDYERYKFLLDSTEIEKKIHNEKMNGISKIWINIKQNMHSFYEKRYSPSFSSTDRKSTDLNSMLCFKDYEESLARTWFTIEERLKDIIGSIDLVHCQYYSQQKNIEKISSFLLEDL